MPLSASALGTRDATNAGNWKLIGPANVEVAEVRPVGSDPFSFDLVCDGVLAVGVWVLEALQIQTPRGESLSAAVISFTAVGAQPFFSVPSQQVTSEEVLRRNLNAALAGPGWRAFIAALGYSDEKVAKAAESAFYQRLLATASGIYLERLAGQKGLDRPPNVKMSDDVLRQLAIAITRDRTNAVALEAVLLAYYGIDATVAHAVSETAAPWALVSGDELRLHIDDVDVDVSFHSADFATISQASAIEVAAVINREFRLLGLRAMATPFVDPESGSTYLAIYSGFSGIKGRLRFYGGGAQRIFHFPENLPTTQAIGTQWTVAPSTALNGVPAGRTRFTWTGGTNPSISQVFVGDYVTIYGSVFQAANRGVFHIVETTPTWFEVEGLVDGLTQTATQTASTDIFWTRPLAINLTGAYKAAVVNTGPGQAEILLPTTAAAVERTASTAWYLNGLPSIALDSGFSGGRLGSTVTVRTTSPHGLTVGRRFMLDEVEIDYDAVLASPEVTISGTPVAGRCWAATRMADGRIMAIFESDTIPMPDTTVNAWIFDPDTDTWGSPILLPLGGASDYPPALTTMADGRILAVDTHEWSVYDPQAGVWTSAVNLEYPAAVPPYFSLVPLPNGTVMSIYAADAVDELWAALFAPLFGFWNVPQTVDTGRLPYCRGVYCESTGDIVVAGGLDGGNPSDRAYLWRSNETALGQWHDIASMPAVHAYPAGISVPVGPRGAVWIAGPHMGNEASQTISLLDLTTLTWSSKDVGIAISDDTMQALVIDANRIFWVPVATDFEWQWHHPWAPAGVNTFTLADTAGPGVDGENFVWAFPISEGRIWATTQDASTDGTTVELRSFSSVRHLSSGNLAGGPWTVTGVIDATTLEFETPGESRYTKIIGGQLTPIRAEAGTIRSGYILDPKTGVAVTDTETQLTAAVDGGPAISLLTVTGLTGFADEPGWLCLSFGTREQTQVIRYLGTSGTNGIRLDPSTVLSRDYGIGTRVTRLDSPGPWSPEDSSKLGVSWLTDSSVGRIEAQKDLVDVIAEGTGITNTVLYPGDRGLGNEGLPKSGTAKISDVVTIYGGDDYLNEAELAREEG